MSKLHSTCPERLHQDFFLRNLSFYKFVLILRGRHSGCCYSVLAALPNVDSRVQKTILRKKIILDHPFCCSCIWSENLRSFIELLNCFWEKCQNCSLGFPRKTLRRFVNLQKIRFLKFFEIRTNFFFGDCRKNFDIVIKTAFWLFRRIYFKQDFLKSW